MEDGTKPFGFQSPIGKKKKNYWSKMNTSGSGQLAKMKYLIGFIVGFGLAMAFHDFILWNLYGLLGMLPH
jgi:hypothetical protein